MFSVTGENLPPGSHDAEATFNTNFYSTDIQDSQISRFAPKYTLRHHRLNAAGFTKVSCRPAPVQRPPVAVMPAENHSCPLAAELATVSRLTKRLPITGSQDWQRQLRWWRRRWPAILGQTASGTTPPMPLAEE